MVCNFFPSKKKQNSELIEMYPGRAHQFHINLLHVQEDNQYAEIDSLPNCTTFSEIPQTYENEVAKEASKAVKNPTDGNIMIPDLLSKIISLEKDSRMGFTEEFRVFNIFVCLF